jgi:hypothetical protein
LALVKENLTVGETGKARQDRKVLDRRPLSPAVTMLVFWLLAAFAIAWGAAGDDELNSQLERLRKESPAEFAKVQELLKVNRKAAEQFLRERFSSASKNPNGGDVFAGRKLAAWLREASFSKIQSSATYEIYPSTALIADYLAVQLKAKGQGESAKAFRDWAGEPGALFAQAWFEVIGSKA